MSHEIIKEFKKRSESFMDWIDLNITDQNVLRAAVEYFEYSEEVLKAIIKIAKIEAAVIIDEEGKNKAVKALLYRFNVDICFNEIKAREELLKGLRKVILEDYHFNGVSFSKGKERIYNI